MVAELSPRVTLVRAPNPSPMTLDGTNGYVVDGGGTLVAIDPGPDDPAHLERFAAIARERRARYAAIVVTHGHPDHWPGAAPLARLVGAPVLAHPFARFPHDRALADGETLEVGEVALQALDAPGHARDHLVLFLAAEGALFTGDVVLGSGTTVIAPPGGAMRSYEATLRRLLAEHGGARRIYGGHGPPVDDPRAKLREYLDHRARREGEIVAALADGASTIAEIVARVYAEVDPRVRPAAARQALAVLEALEAEGRVRATLLDRAPTPEERALLDPDLRRVAGADVEVVRRELGLPEGGEPLRAYALT